MNNFETDRSPQYPNFMDLLGLNRLPGDAVEQSENMVVPATDPILTSRYAKRKTSVAVIPFPKVTVYVKAAGASFPVYVSIPSGMKYVLIGSNNTFAFAIGGSSMWLSGIAPDASGTVDASFIPGCIYNGSPLIFNCSGLNQIAIVGTFGTDVQCIFWDDLE